MKKNMQEIPIMSLRKSWKWVKRILLYNWLEPVERKGISYFFDNILDDFYFLLKKDSFKNLKIKVNWNNLPLIWWNIWKYTENDKKEFLEKYNI